ncbi:hypothetical protein KCP78_19345 [Salmonella enterica subsp. enterica]|nr:hypothetical protein KCP78_19345 [Salmonella enterica subsp. enterica]
MQTGAGISPHARAGQAASRFEEYALIGTRERRAATSFAARWSGWCSNAAAARLSSAAHRE